MPPRTPWWIDGVSPKVQVWAVPGEPEWHKVSFVPAGISATQRMRVRVVVEVDDGAQWLLRPSPDRPDLHDTPMNTFDWWDGPGVD